MRFVKIIGCLSLLIFLNISVVQANSHSSEDDLLMCESLFQNNSVETRILGYESNEGDISEVVPGETFQLFGNISNNNSFAIADVTVYARIFSADTSDTAGHFDIHSYQSISTGLYLEPNGTISLDEMIALPNELGAGDYYVDLYAKSFGRFPLGKKEMFEVSEHDAIRVTVVTDEETPNHVIIDRLRTSVEGQPYVATNVPIVIEPNSSDEITIRTFISNLEGEWPALGQFTWDIYAGDRINKSTHIASTSRDIKLVPGTETVLWYELQDSYRYPYYTIVGTLSVGDGSSPDSHIIIPVSTTVDLVSSYSIDPLDFFALTTDNDLGGRLEALVCYQGFFISNLNDPVLEIAFKDDSQIFGELVLDSDHPSFVMMPWRASYAVTIPLAGDIGPFTLTTSVSSTEELVSHSQIDVTCENYPKLCDESYQDAAARDNKVGLDSRQLIVGFALLAIFIIFLVGYKIIHRRKLLADNNIF